MNNYVPSNFDKSMLDVMIEAGAVQFWIIIFIGLVFIGLLVMILESKNKRVEKVKKYIGESIEEIFGEDK